MGYTEVRFTLQFLLLKLFIFVPGKESDLVKELAKQTLCFQFLLKK